ncbi:MAG TPA: AAA family ATPase [Candidatus Limnocylindria bacterium]|nr:AAA family ATPase [Candidatus Limnocylindria bacterium]
MLASREQAIVLITGISAAGKSTVAQLLAERLPRSVHVRGDVFRRMIVGGRADMTADPSDEAVRQLELRYRLMVTMCQAYFDAGFTIVAHDVILGGHLAEVVASITRRPLIVVVLAPRAEVVSARENARQKTGYGGDLTPELLDRGLQMDTGRLGLWLDTSEQTPSETVDAILQRAWNEGRIA